MTQITIRITNNFGNKAVYPVCETARKLADLIGTKQAQRKILSRNNT